MLLLDTAGFKHVFDIIFLRPHIVTGMATAFAIWASCWGFSCPDDAAADPKEAELQRSKHRRFELKGIAHLAFCTKVIAGLGCRAAAHKVEGYMGNLPCTLSPVWYKMYMPFDTMCNSHCARVMPVALQGYYCLCKVAFSMAEVTCLLIDGSLISG